MSLKSWNRETSISITKIINAMKIKSDKYYINTGNFYRTDRKLNKQQKLFTTYSRLMSLINKKNST